MPLVLRVIGVEGGDKKFTATVATVRGSGFGGSAVSMTIIGN
jgi:hypothetical protein